MKALNILILFIFTLVLVNCSIFSNARDGGEISYITTNISPQSYYIHPSNKKIKFNCKKDTTLTNWYILFGSISIFRETDRSRFDNSLIWRIQESKKNWADYVLSILLTTFTSISRSSVDIEKCTLELPQPPVIEKTTPNEKTIEEEKSESPTKNENTDLEKKDNESKTIKKTSTELEKSKPAIEKELKSNQEKKDNPKTEAIEKEKQPTPEKKSK